MSTIHDPRYELLIEALIKLRKDLGITQEALASRLNEHQSYVAKVEGRDRRLDIIELFDWLEGLDYKSLQFFQDMGWFPNDQGVIAYPLKGDVRPHPNGVLQQLVWEGQRKEVLLEGITREQYLYVEEKVTEIFSRLNERKPNLKNREAIADALELAIAELKDLNPSDIYHHIIYRLYIREYKRSKPEQSWVRAGGEALELFIERHYTKILEPHGIILKALISPNAKKVALNEMGLRGEVGDSKLDVALYGRFQEREVIFGGVHSKASLAERVSDDVPCSEAMQRKGYASILYTFDVKSFPPPQGELINYGEMGSDDSPSDKRRLIEEQGSFDACFSYNLRTQPSQPKTKSGKRIFVAPLKEGVDFFPDFVINSWEKFKEKLTPQ